MTRFRISSALFVALCTFSVVGCGDGDRHAAFKEKNKTNVARVSTCFKLYASRNGQNAPKDQEELTAFLKSPNIKKNIERLGISQDDVDAIFVSERDGKPLKIKWGGKVNPEMAMPVAFETVGVDGIRLVAADVVLEVEDDDEYEDLWNGIYEPEWLTLKKSIGDSGESGVDE